MRYAAALVIGVGFLMCGCTSREVPRVTSPNGRLEAIVLESDCGVSCDVLDDVWVVAKGRRLVKKWLGSTTQLGTNMRTVSILSGMLTAV